MPRVKKSANPAFAPCRDIYFSWFDANHQYAVIFNGADGEALNKILEWLAKSFTKKYERLPTVQEVVASFKVIFNNYEHWGYWKGKAKRLTTIYYGIQEITDNIKANNKYVTTSKQQQHQNGKSGTGINSGTDARAYSIMQKYRDQKMGTSDKC